MRVRILLPLPDIGLNRYDSSRFSLFSAKSAPFCRVLCPYEKAGEAGHVYTYLWLGDTYYAPKEGAPDYNKAFDYYSKAAALGTPDAMGNLGVMCAAGYGVEKDEEKAEEYYQWAQELRSR